MKFCNFLVMLLVVQAVVSVQELPIPISVTNGGILGDWGNVQFCPLGAKASAFSIKVESKSLVGDDTGMNGIRLHCSSENGSETVIESATQIWGDWGEKMSCSNNSYLTAYSLRVQPLSGGDETAANDINFHCSNNETLHGNGLAVGSFGERSEECSTGICAIETRVQEAQGIFGDDTALNDVILYCC